MQNFKLCRNWIVKVANGCLVILYCFYTSTQCIFSTICLNGFLAHEIMSVFGRIRILYKVFFCKIDDITIKLFKQNKMNGFWLKSSSIRSANVHIQIVYCIVFRILHLSNSITHKSYFWCEFNDNKNSGFCTLAIKSEMTRELTTAKKSEKKKSKENCTKYKVLK